IQRTFSDGIERYAKAYIVIAEMEGCLAQLKQKIEKGHANSTELEVEATELEEVIHTQKQWALHFLTKCSKIQLCCETDTLAVSFPEYLWGNESTYYRGDGGSMIDLYEQVLTESYPDLFDKDNEDQFFLLSGEKENFLSGIIKPDRYSSLIQAACKYRKFDYKLPKPDLDSLKKEISSIPEDDKVFFDITDLLKTTTANERAKLLKDLNELLKKNSDKNDKIILGGIITLSELDVGVGNYIFLNTSAWGGFVEEALLDFQGNIGAYPEPVLLKASIFRELSKRTSQEFLFAEDSSVKEIGINLLEGKINQKEIQRPNEEIQTLNEEIQQLLDVSSTSSLLINEHYRKVFKLCFTKLCNQPPSFFNQDNLSSSERYSLLIYMNSLQELKNCIEQMRSTDSFEVALLEANKGIEEILNLINFWSPTEELQVPKLFARSIQDDSQIHHGSYLFSSGMAAIDHAFDILLKLKPNAQVTFLDASYYEFTLEPGFKDYLKGCCTVNVSNAEEALQSAAKQDIIFLDLYPNYATVLKLERNPVEKIIEEGLEGKTAESPLTILLDISTSSLAEPEVGEIIAKYKEQIATGCLQILIVNSLAKYSMNGFDKYTGGLIQCFCKHDNSHLSLNLPKASERDMISPQAKKLFQFFLMEEQVALTTSYWEACTNNTNVVYETVKPLTQEDSFVQVAIKDSKIPMIGIHFRNFLNGLESSTKSSTEKITESTEENSSESSDEDNPLVSLVNLMQYHIYGLAKKEELPVFIRGSFGFPHTAIIECHTALRLALGAL
ncbi:MAG: hypothetical protein ACXU9U_00395, partial [Parachlamydiaceae bacterium]